MSLDTGAIYTVNQRVAVDGGVAVGPSAFAGVSIIIGAVSGHASVRDRLRDAHLRGDR